MTHRMPFSITRLGENSICPNPEMSPPYNLRIIAENSATSTTDGSSDTTDGSSDTTDGSSDTTEGLFSNRSQSTPKTILTSTRKASRPALFMPRASEVRAASTEIALDHAPTLLTTLTRTVPCLQLAAAFYFQLGLRLPREPYTYSMKRDFIRVGHLSIMTEVYS